MTPFKIQADNLRRFADALYDLADRIENGEYTHVSGSSAINVESEVVTDSVSTDGQSVKSTIPHMISVTVNNKYRKVILK